MLKPRAEPIPTTPAKRPRRLWLSVGVAVLAVGAIVAVVVMSATPSGTPTPTAIAAPVQTPSVDPPPVAKTPAAPKEPATFAELMAWPPERLGELDIALVNLLCAEGLPGSEDLDIPKVRKTLDLWATAVRGETERQLYMFHRNPADYEDSEPYFRMLVLLTVLQLDLGVHYNLARVNDPDFGNSKDQFIHGMVNCDNGGTCVSMPALYVAVARRLGYPLKLVLAHEHVFCRWDDGKGAVKNFDGASRGLHSYPDEHYRQWPRPITDDQLKHRELLVSLTPAEELSVFLAARGHCFAVHKRLKEARECYVTAGKHFPSAIAYPYLLAAVDASLNPPFRVQPGAPQNPRSNFGMPTVSHPRDQRRR